MPRSTLSSNGRITLPKEIRRHLDVKEGDRIEFVIEAAGRVVLMPARSRLGELWGMLHEPGRKALSIEEMNGAVERHHGRRR